MTPVRNFLSTPGEIAKFEFFSGIILLSRYECNALPALERALAWEPGDEIDERATAIRALLKHEATHFLDLTTTAWGAQYIFRKLQLLREMEIGGEAYERAREVFALDSSELLMHQEMVEIGDVFPSSCDTIQHELIYSEEYGVCLFIHYLKDGQCHHKVPISMLSLLEANATASEFLSLLQCADSKVDLIDRQLSLEQAEREMNQLLNDPGLLEYSVFLHLTRVHFPELSLSDLLKFVAALARFSLDASAIETAELANPIEQSFINRRLGDGLAMELRRGHHRQLIFFKTVLFMYGWMQKMEQEAQGNYLEVIRKRPGDAIREMWEGAFNMHFATHSTIRALEASMNVDLIPEHASIKDREIFAESSKSNRDLLATTSFGLLSFQDIKLLNAQLGDDTEVVFPNRIDIDVNVYFNKNVKIFAKLDEVFRNMKHKRFHLPPGSAGMLML